MDKKKAKKLTLKKELIVRLNLNEQNAVRGGTDTVQANGGMSATCVQNGC